MACTRYLVSTRIFRILKFYIAQKNVLHSRRYAGNPRRDTGAAVGPGNMQQGAQTQGAYGRSDADVVVGLGNVPLNQRVFPDAVGPSARASCAEVRQAVASELSS